MISVSEEGEGLLDNGFSARSLAEERPVDDMYMDQLVDIADVTEQVTAMIDAAGAQTDAEAAAAATEAVESMEETMSADVGDGFTVQVVALYNGGRYSAYTYRRYTDVRLVMAPEARLGYFGGDFDNFTYPRYALDFSFFRIYGDDGQPLHTDHYFPLSTEGVDEDDLIFVVGNPGSTSRGLTVAQLETTRDFLVPIILQSAAGLRGPVQIFGGDWSTPDGSCIRDYIHVLDLAAAHVKSLAWMDRQPEAPLLEILNVGTGRGTSVREALAAFERATGEVIGFELADRRHGDIEQIYANVERAERILGWKAERSLDEAMRDAWRWQSGLVPR